MDACPDVDGERHTRRRRRVAHAASLASPALVLMLAFAFFYVGAFHDPTPHHVPVAVVGPPAVAAQLNRLPGDPLDARQASSRADALSQIDDREVYGAYEAATNRLFVASAANRATAIALEQTFNRIAAAQHRPGRPRHRRQAAAAQGPQRHRGVLRGDRVDVRRLHRRDADRLDRKPAQQQQAACGSADRSARGVWHRRRDPQRGHAARELRGVLGPRGRAVRDRGADHLRQRRRHSRHPGRGRPGRDRARHSRLRDPRQLRVGRAVRPTAAAGPVEDDRRRVAAGRERRPGAVGAVLRRRADRGPDSRAGRSGRPWVRCSRSRSAAASWTRPTPRQRPPREQRCEPNRRIAITSPPTRRRHVKDPHPPDDVTHAGAVHRRAHRLRPRTFEDLQQERRRLPRRSTHLGADRGRRHGRLGGVWERLHYDWSNPDRVVLTTTDSNTWGGASGYTYTFTRRPDGKTDIDVVIIREGKNAKGKLLGLVLGTRRQGRPRKGLRRERQSDRGPRQRDRRDAGSTTRDRSDRSRRDRGRAGDAGDGRVGSIASTGATAATTPSPAGILEGLGWDNAPAPALVAKRLLEGVLGHEIRRGTRALSTTPRTGGSASPTAPSYGLLLGSRRKPRVWFGLPFGAAVWVSGYVVLPPFGVYKPIWKYDLETLGRTWTHTSSTGRPPRPRSRLLDGGEVDR